jgi:lipid A disaccharide synthetase
MPKKSLRILIVAGEASGDLHGSHLVEAIKSFHPKCRFFGVGGKKMRAEGVETFFDIERMGAIGAIEILGELPLYIKVYRTLAAEISSGKYDAAILIDYPTLNLMLAKFLYFILSVRKSGPGVKAGSNKFVRRSAECLWCFHLKSACTWKREWMPSF